MLFRGMRARPVSDTVYSTSIMLVDIVFLRHEGAKRTRAEVLAAQPLRAELTVRAVEFSALAELSFPWDPPGHGTARICLVECRLKHMRGSSFVLVGGEPYGPVWETKHRPQAWWCRVAVGEPTTAPVKPAPTGVDQRLTPRPGGELADRRR